MTKIRIPAIENDASHEEILRTAINKPGHGLILGIYKPAGLFLKISATKPELLLMEIDICEEIAIANRTKTIYTQGYIPKSKNHIYEKDRTRTLF